MMRALLAAALASVLVSACVPATQPTVLGFDTNDPTMNAAVREAQRSLPLFLRNAVSGGESLDGAGVKVALPSASGGEEVIWVGPFVENENGLFGGFLANEPIDLPGRTLGSPILFEQSQIEDWSWTGADGLVYGNYTTRVMAATGLLPTDSFATLSPDPIPPGWR
jgi:uncharacterized protein YegJ (DUF2314 family)